MNIRTAILKAADSIEQNPHLFIFMVTGIPNDCGTPGCALGWIGYHAGITGLAQIQVPPFLGFYEDWKKEVEVFYTRLDATNDWRHNAPECAKALRLYADKYHPEDNAIPESVMAIFNTKQVVEEHP